MTYISHCGDARPLLLCTQAICVLTGAVSVQIPCPPLNWVVYLLLSLYSDTALETGSIHTPYLRGSSCSLEALKHKCCQSPWSRFSQIFFDYFMSAVTVADPQLRRCAFSLNSDIYVICLNSLAGGYSIDPESILEKMTLSLQCWLCYGPCQNQLTILRFSFVSWLFHSTALWYLFLFRPVPHCFDYCSFVVFFKIKMNEPSKIFLQCFIVSD